MFSSSPYESLTDESVSYASWVIKHGHCFRVSEWLAVDELTSIPPRARAVLDRNPGEASDLKVYIGPGTENYAPFYDAGAVQLPLQYGQGIVVADIASFTDRLRESGTVYRHAIITPLEQSAPTPSSFTITTRDAAVPALTVTALSSGFADAVNRSAWCICADGAFGSMSLYIELVYRQSTLVGAKIGACIALERAMLREKTRAQEALQGPRPPRGGIHNAESLGFLCARYRKATEEVVLHLSQSEFCAMNATFPVLRAALAASTRTELPTTCFYDIPLKPLSWKTRSDTWVGRVLVQTFVSTPGEDCSERTEFLLLSAVYVDL